MMNISNQSSPSPSISSDIPNSGADKKANPKYFTPPLHLLNEIRLFVIFFEKYMDSCIDMYARTNDYEYVVLSEMFAVIKRDVLIGAEKRVRKYTVSRDFNSFDRQVVGPLLDKKNKINYDAVDKIITTYQNTQRWFIVKFLNLILHDRPPSHGDHEIYVLYARRRCLQLVYLAKTTNNALARQKFNGLNLIGVITSNIKTFSDASHAKTLKVFTTNINKKIIALHDEYLKSEDQGPT